jgi:hypothetical protein
MNFPRKKHELCVLTWGRIKNQELCLSAW